MKLIVIYGPVAVGKLSVAKELSKKTGYRLFHNHVVNDALATVMDFGGKKFWKHGNDLKLKLIEIAAEEKQKGLIFTMALHDKHKKGGIKFINRLEKRMKKYKIKTIYVKLTTHLEELKKRVKHPERKKFKKIKSIKLLTNNYTKEDDNLLLPSVKTLLIDNTKKSPKKVAEEIIKKYKLK